MLRSLKKTLEDVSDHFGLRRHPKTTLLRPQARGKEMGPVCVWDLLGPGGWSARAGRLAPSRA